VADFAAALIRSPVERFAVVPLNARHEPLTRRPLVVSVGTLNASIVHPREVFAPLVRLRAAAFIAVHNHPSGDPGHSEEDVGITRRLSQAGEIMGIGLLDHVIVARRGFESLRERGKL
jgi:DNA repair protein RadC